MRKNQKCCKLTENNRQIETDKYTKTEVTSIPFIIEKNEKFLKKLATLLQKFLGSPKFWFVRKSSNKSGSSYREMTVMI